MFTVCYVILIALYTSAIFDYKVGVFALIVLAITSAVLIMKTHSAEVYGNLHVDHSKIKPRR